jgi:hypothetical protein
MQNSLLLISTTPIVKQIFTLVCKKTGMDLVVSDTIEATAKYDIVVADSTFISDELNTIKPHAKRLGVISNRDIEFEIAKDFIIPLPFLPSTLQSILEEQQRIVSELSLSKKTYVTSVEVENEQYNTAELENLLDDDKSSDDEDLEDDTTEINIESLNIPKESEELNPALDYLESLANNIADDMDEESDESIVSLASLNKGGVLDVTELAKINSIFGDEDSKPSHAQSFISHEEKEDPWQDLSSIIDQAISEVNSSDELSSRQVKESNTIDIKLNDYNLEDLKPFLSLLNQEIIDQLTNGKKITVNLELEKDDD